MKKIITNQKHYLTWLIFNCDFKAKSTVSTFYIRYKIKQKIYIR